MKIVDIRNTSSYIVNDFFSDENLQTYFNSLDLNVLSVNGRPQQRAGMFMGENIEGSTRWLRCPSIEGQTIYEPTETVQTMVSEIRESFPELDHDWNIMKIQKYDDGQIGMKSHADKILDLAEGVPILIARFGAARVAVLTHKESKEEEHIFMPNNSLLVLSYADNLKYTHGVAEAPGLTGSSYSVVFRQSVTWLHESGLVWGLRTPFKVEADLNRTAISHWTKEQQRKALVKVYSQENKDVNISLDDYSEIIENCIYP